MASPCQFLEDAIAAAKRAVQFDSDGQYEPAAYFYKVSAQLLLKAADVSPTEKAESLRAKSIEYKDRAQSLESMKHEERVFHEDKHKTLLKRFYFLMQQALDADAADFKGTAVQLYTNAIEFVTKNPELMQGETKGLALQALERAEILKGKFL